MENTQARRFIVNGRVQGVGYRNFVQHLAGKLGVHGFVRNRRDGSVEVFAMGTSKQLQQLRGALAKGPFMSKVSGIHEEPDALDMRYLGDFTIEYTV